MGLNGTRDVIGPASGAGGSEAASWVSHVSTAAFRSSCRGVYLVPG